MIERLSGDYNRGYTKAIMDLIEIFDNIQLDLAYNKKRLTAKLIKSLLNCCLNNRENIRESVNGFIRWNNKLNDFEFYEPGRDES